MRVALFTCLFVVCFGHEAHQCGDNLGSCRGAPRASLMQVGSSNKRRLSLASQSASRSGSRVSHALAGFEKYTNNLVRKYMTDKEIMPMDNETKQAIETVRGYIRGLFTQLNVSHYHDIERIHRKCGQPAQDYCAGAYFNDTHAGAGGTLEEWKDKVNTAREEHVNCRIREFNDSCQLNADCKAYDDYRHVGLDGFDTALANYEQRVHCAQGDLSKLAPDFINTVDGSKRQQMENCLDDFQTWFEGLYALYLACDRTTAQKEDCTTFQKDFEEKHCTYNYKLNQTCEGYQICIDEAIEDCIGNDFGLCQEVDILVDARKAENETGERILCLLTVLVDTANESKKNELDKCKNQTYDTSYFDLVCPGVVGPPTHDPPYDHCNDIEAVSCSWEFLWAYYGNNRAPVSGPETGAKHMPYETVCDCLYKCDLLHRVNEDVVQWEPCHTDDFNNPIGTEQCCPIPDPAIPPSEGLTTVPEDLRRCEDYK